jgi:hypothetical protein
LFGALVKKEVDLYRKKQGTFFRSGPKVKDRARWSHKNYNGWVSLQRSTGEVVVVEIGARQKDAAPWQLLHTLVGFVVRHFGSKIMAIQIQFPNGTSRSCSRAVSDFYEAAA